MFKTSSISMFGSVLLILFVSLRIHSAEITYPEYHTHYVEDDCKSDETIIYSLDANYPQTSTGFLKAVRVAPYSPHKNCTILLEPPPGYGVVLAIRKSDFIESDRIYCADYLKVLVPAPYIPETICRFIFDMQETRSFYVEGTMKLLYHTEGRRFGKYHDEGFEAVMTVVGPEHSHCPSSDHFRCQNGRCTWKKLVCDGHNNCGDLSDEINCGVHQEDLRGGISQFVMYVCMAVLLVLCVATVATWTVTGKKLRLLISRDLRATHLDCGDMKSVRKASKEPKFNSLSSARDSDGGFSNMCYSAETTSRVPPPLYKP